MPLHNIDTPDTAEKRAPVEGAIPRAGQSRQVGHIEVVRLRRRSRKHADLMLYRGTPASKHSTARSVQVTISPANGQKPPAPWMDRENGRIHLSYSSKEHPDVIALAKAPGDHLCYFWVSGDGTQSHAWLLKAD